MFKVGQRSLLDSGKVCDSLLLKGCRKVPLSNYNCSLRQTGRRIKLLPDLVWHFKVRSEYKVMHYPPEGRVKEWPWCCERSKTFNRGKFPTTKSCLMSHLLEITVTA